MFDIFNRSLFIEILVQVIFACLFFLYWRKASLMSHCMVLNIGLAAAEK